MGRSGFLWFSPPSKITLKREHNPPFGGLCSEDEFVRVRNVNDNVSAKHVNRVDDIFSAFWDVS